MLNTNIWEKDLFINKNIPYLFKKVIREYDMSEAGFNMLRENEILDRDTIEDLLKHTKKERHIMIGKMEANNSVLKETKKELFKEYRKRFFYENDLLENDVISIKKDAIFVTRECDCLKYGEYVKFVPKSTYTSYIRLNERFEFYYSTSKLDVKGIRDDLLELHKEYMIDFIKSFFYKMEVDTPENVIQYTKRFIDKYKYRELPIEYYRELNALSDFAYNDGTFSSYAWEDDINKLDITHNLFLILLKLVKIPL